MTMIEHQMVLLVWHDAHAVNEGDWMEADEIGDDPCIVETVGWLLPEKKKDHVVVAQSVTDDGALDGVLAVPVGMVKKLVVLGFDAHDVPPFCIGAGAGVAPN